MLTESFSRERELERTLEKFSDVFKTNWVAAAILLASIRKLESFPFRRPPIHLRAQIEAELIRNVQNGVLEPVNTLCAFPTVNVVKPIGAIRICGAFKPLNQILIVDQYPIPIPTELFSALAGGQRFSKIDLKDAYNQLRIDDESQRYLVINTHKGLFKYRRLPFGISSAPAIFQRVMAKVLKNLKGVNIYMDDILVTGKDMENLSAVLQRLQQYGLRIKREKCSFCQQSVQYLGHIIDSEGIRLCEERERERE